MYFKHRILLAAVRAPLMAPTDDGAGAAGGGVTGGDDNASAAPKSNSEKTVKARVLTDCEHGKSNDVVALPASVAKDATSLGLIDTDKAAVAYAATLPQNQPTPADSAA